MRFDFETYIYKSKYVVASLFFIFVLIIGCSEDSSNPIDASKVTVSPAVLDFEVVKTGQAISKNITINNDNSSPVEIDLTIEGADKSSFAIEGESKLVITANENKIVKINFNPSTTKKYSAKLNAGTYGSVELIGEASDDIVIQVSPDTLNYGIVKINNVITQTLNVKNVSNNDIELIAFLDGPDKDIFKIQTNFEGVLKQNESAPIEVNATPSELKKYTASISIALKINNLPGEVYAVVPLVCEGVDKLNLIVSPSELKFDNIVIGSKATDKVIFQNLSGSMIKISPKLAGTNASSFNIDKFPATELANGEKDTLLVSFSPTELKTYTAQLIIDEMETVSIPVTGSTSQMNDLSIQQSTLDFGTVELGLSKELTLSVKNISTSQLTLVTAISNASNNVFTVTDKPASLNSNASGEIKINYSPKAVAVYNEKLTITTSNDSKYEVTLKGKVSQTQDLKLNAVFTGSKPVIDGNDNEWGAASEMSMTLTQVESTAGDQRTFNATLKAMYDGEYIYLLAKVYDNTKDDLPNKFEFKGGDPTDDNNWTMNTNGQDGMSFIFPITDNVTGFGKSFEQAACSTACHSANFITTYESGMYPGTGSIDMWIWKAGTTNPQGHADDQFAAGNIERRQGDIVGKSFEYENFRDIKVGGSLLPISMAAGDNGGIDKYRYLWDATSKPFDGTANNPATGQAWKQGDITPGWKLRIPENTFDEGFRGDVEAKGVHKGTYWIVEFKRKLNTESTNNDDIVINTNMELPFSFAYFENVRKYASFEYINLNKNPRPSHFGPSNYVITLKFLK